MLDTFILTFQLFTCLPLHKQVEVHDERLIQGVVFWPIVGLVIGIFDLLIFGLASRVLSVSIAAVFAVMAELWITRGFHLDGLCDTADALFSSRSRERMLEIMKDSHIGTFGVVAAILDLGLKFLLIFQAANPELMLVAAPVAGKMVQGIGMYRVNYPRETGLGKSYIGRVPLGITVISSGLGGLILAGCLIGMGFGPVAGIGFPLLACLVAWLFKRHMQKVIGGMTGDTQGALSEVTEIFLMLLMVVA